MSDLIQIKVHKSSNYTTISLRAVEDPRLSWKAKGLHLYLYSRPQGWKLHYADLLKRAQDGNASLKSAVEELKQHAYLKIHQMRKNGRFAHSLWEVYEAPCVFSPYVGFPYTGKPHAEKPSPENPPLTNKHISNKHSNKTTTEQPVVVHDFENIQKLTKGTPFEQLSVNDLAWMMKKYAIDSHRLSHMLDVLSFQSRKGWRVNDPKRTIIAALRDGIAEPSDFVPFKIRKKTHAMERRERQRNRKEEPEWFEQEMERFEAIAPEEQEVWLKKAADQVRGFTRLDDAITSVAVRLWSKTKEVVSNDSFFYR
jgi:hypothetical protein